MGWVVQRHFKRHSGKQMAGLASSKQAWTKMHRLETENMAPSHLEFSWRCISNVPLNHSRKLHRKRLLKGDPNHFPGMLLEPSKTLCPSNQLALTLALLLPVGKKPCLCYCLLHAELWFVFRDRSMISWNNFFGNNKLSCFGEMHVFFGSEYKWHPLILHHQIFLSVLIGENCRATVRKKPK